MSDFSFFFSKMICNFGFHSKRGIMLYTCIVGYTACVLASRVEPVLNCVSTCDSFGNLRRLDGKQPRLSRIAILWKFRAMTQC